MLGPVSVHDAQRPSHSREGQDATQGCATSIPGLDCWSHWPSAVYHPGSAAWRAHPRKVTHAAPDHGRYGLVIQKSRPAAVPRGVVPFYRGRIVVLSSAGRAVIMSGHEAFGNYLCGYVTQ